MIDPWGSELVEDYSKLIKELGLQPFDSTILKKFPKPNRLMRRGIVFGHMELEQLLEAKKRKKPFYCLTGIMPSSEKLHFGNKLTIEDVAYFQSIGAKTFVCIADLESAATRNVSLEDAKKRAMSFHIPAWIALGLNPKKALFYFQSKNELVKNHAAIFSSRATLNEFRAIYGEQQLHPSRIMAGLIQVADILFPQFKERMPGVIPVGPDQLPHIRLTRDIARRTKSEYNFFLPGTMVHKFTPSLDGSIKMSKSQPNSFISIPEDAEIAAKKMSNALSGGRATVAEQKQKGGEIEKCIVFEFYKQHLIEDDKKLQKVFDDCKNGKLLCGECKQMASDLMKKFMQDFNKKFDKAKKVKVKFV